MAGGDVLSRAAKGESINLGDIVNDPKKQKRFFVINVKKGIEKGPFNSMTEAQIFLDKINDAKPEFAVFRKIIVK